MWIIMDKYINYDSGEFKELAGEIEQTLNDVQDVRDKYSPDLVR